MWLAGITLSWLPRQIQLAEKCTTWRPGVFSAVICYGVIMYVDREEAVKEISRTSVRGPRAISAGTPSDALRTLLSSGYTLDAKQALQTILSTWLKRKGASYYSRDAMNCVLTASGLGRTHCTRRNQEISHPQEGPLGVDNVLEALAMRN